MIIDVSQVRFSGNKNFTMRHEITLNERVSGRVFGENELVEVKSSDSVFYALVTYKSVDSDIMAFVSPELKGSINTDTFEVNRLKQASIKNILKARVNCLHDNKVEISENLLRSLSHNENDRFILINNFNGYRLDLSTDDVVINENETDVLRLGIKHRRLLDIELPTYISNHYLEDLGQDIESYYKSENDNVKFDDYYDAVNSFKRTYNKSNLSMLTLYSIPDDKKRSIKSTINKKRKLVFTKILSFLIRQRKISLRVVRPCPTDESEITVRISEVIMKLLGLEETDNVIIRNGEHCVKAKVLLIDKDSIIAQENRLKFEQELDIIVGIPAYMRVDLNLNYINSTVTVERDLVYLFKKNLNNQVLTIIGFLVSLSFIDKLISNIALKVLAYSIIVLLLIFISFSQIREKVSK